MARYRTEFNLDISDIDRIERALRNDIARYALSAESCGAEPAQRREVDALNQLLGKLHNQKIFYAQIRVPHVPAA